MTKIDPGTEEERMALPAKDIDKDNNDDDFTTTTKSDYDEKFRRESRKSHRRLLSLVLVVLALGILALLVATQIAVRDELHSLQSQQRLLLDTVTSSNGSWPGGRVNVNLIARLIEEAREGAREVGEIFRGKRSHRRWCGPGAPCHDDGDDDEDDDNDARSKIPVIHLKGCNFSKPNRSCPVKNVETPPAMVPTLISAWRRPNWLVDSKAFEFRGAEGIILVKEPGVYYVYSQFYFVTAGARCAYRLRFGRDSGKFVTCIQDITDDGDTTEESSSSSPETSTSVIRAWRPCFLGFTQFLDSGTELKMEYLDGHGNCRSDLKKGLLHSYWGAVQLNRAEKNEREKEEPKIDEKEKAWRKKQIEA